MRYKQIIRAAFGGCIERPWRNRSHQFVLGDPKHGSVKHHDEFAIKVDSYGEAFELVEKGYAIRMSDGRNPPSLVTAGSLTILDEHLPHLDALWTYTVPVAPHSLNTVLNDLRASLVAEAQAVAVFASIDAARSLLNLDQGEENLFDEIEPANVDLSSFAVTRVVGKAYDYAYGATPGFLMADEDVDELEVFLERSSQAATNRFSNPMHNERSALRMTLEMAYARWQLRECSDLTVSRMAFLARMTETAVRNSLSKEKIRPVDGLVPFEKALPWLEARQNFLPQREFERPGAATIFDLIHDLRSDSSDKPFASAITKRIRWNDEGKRGLLASALSIAEQIDATVKGGRMPLVSDLRAIARHLELPIDGFAVTMLGYFEAELMP